MGTDVNIILCGFKSCGKTTIGQQTSKLLQREFTDVDDLCERLYLDKMGDPRLCREIFLTHGEQYFRDLERAAIQGIDTDNALIATGAGAVLDPRSVAKLKEKGIFIYLRLNSEILKKRLLKGVLPAYLDVSNPDESFEKMFDERKNIYEQIADGELDVSFLSIAESAETLCNTVQELMRPYV
ncbi:MAG: shikimate kinase [Chlamydiales bacterium]